MGGGGKKAGSKPSLPKEIEDLITQQIGRADEMFNIGMPLTSEGGRISEEVLRTGFSEALRPALISELEERKRAGGEELRLTEEALARKGVTGSQFQKALVPIQEKIAANVAGAPAELAAPIFEQATKGAFGSVGPSLEALGASGVASGEATVPGRQAGGAKGALGGGVSGAATGTMTAGWPWGTVVGGVAGAAKGAK